MSVCAALALAQIRSAPIPGVHMTSSLSDTTYVSLWVVSAERTAAQIESALGLVSDHRVNKGDPIGRSGVRADSIVQYHSKLGTAARIADHVDAVLARIEPAKGSLTELVRSGTVSVELWISSEIVDSGVQLRFGASQVALLAELGATLNLGIVFHEGAEYYRSRDRRREAL